jgi:hypothetical protein
MSPSSLTPTQPGLLDPIRNRVLDVARSLIGQREDPSNQGAIVRKVCAPFLARDAFTRLYASHRLEWCSGFACYCWVQAWQGFRAIASVHTLSLWMRCAAKGWTRRAGQVQVLDPQPADLIFFCSRHDRQIAHVGLVEQAGAKTVLTIEGNIRVRPDDSGSVGTRSYALIDPIIFGVATPTPPSPTEDLP